jgi:hypothetical protein
VRDRKRGNADLIGSIDALEKSFFRVEAPADAPPDWPQQVRQWQEQAVDQLFAALRLVEVHPKQGQNVRNDVNLRAAQALGVVLGSKDLAFHRNEKDVAALRSALARGLMDVLGDDFGRESARSHSVPQAVLEATFVALARTNDPKAFDWIVKEYVHTRGGDFEEARLIAAHKALTLFAKVPGRKRYDVVEVMIRIYSGTDASAKQSTPEGRANKRMWDHVRVTTIAAINHLATPPGGRPPANAEGLGLTTMDELALWWRAHKRTTDAVWK